MKNSLFYVAPWLFMRRDPSRGYVLSGRVFGVGLKVTDTRIWRPCYSDTFARCAFSVGPYRIRLMR